MQLSIFEDQLSAITASTAAGVSIEEQLFNIPRVKLSAITASTAAGVSIEEQLFNIPRVKLCINSKLIIYSASVV